MDKFTTIPGRCAVAPKQRRYRPDHPGGVPQERLANGLRGRALRGLAQGRDVVLNDPRYAQGSVLVAGPDFGTGSSREHAVWA